jgi:site-specific DNA-methyltransferase (adenine-specific)
MTVSRQYEIHNVDAFDWLDQAAPNSIHAVVTDPPYGFIEYTPKELEKRGNRTGGIWRLPQSYDGQKRQPIPRFTVLGQREHQQIEGFFTLFAQKLLPVIVPGGHVFVATNPLVSHLAYLPFVRAGFEKRGEIVRVVHTLRGGDRPKNAHTEFPDLSVIPRGSWEPWGLFRKPCEGRVSDNLRKWHAGALRRPSQDEPFKDLILSAPASRNERMIAPHPSLKPQSFLRQLVHAALPLGTGTILDPFMGSGSTIAAALALELRSVGLEINREYFLLAQQAIPLLAALKVVSGARITAVGRSPESAPVRARGAG